MLTTCLDKANSRYLKSKKKRTLLTLASETTVKGSAWRRMSSMPTGLPKYLKLSIKCLTKGILYSSSISNSDITEIKAEIKIKDISIYEINTY